MAEKKQEKPKLPEVKNEQTILYKFGNMISGILSSVLGTTKSKSEDKKSEVPKSKPKEDK
jgi:hypothetical protein